jgi:hypothetical protein
MAGAGYKLFQTGDVLTAAQVNTYLNEQTVMVFASAAARTSALTSVLAEGMVSYLQDTNAVEVYDGSAWVSIGSSGDITSVTTGTDSGLAGGATSGAVDLKLRLQFDNQTGTTYTLAGNDLNQLVTCNNSGSITVTVPPSVFTAGDQIHVQQIGTGQVTFAQGSGVTITSTGATASSPKLRVRYSACTVICTASNTFTIVGDLA